MRYVSEFTCRLAHSTDSNVTMIALNDFPPGSVVVFKFRMNDSQSSCSERLRGLISSLYNPSSALSDLISRLSLLDLNHALFRCDQEEREMSGGKRGVYALSGYGPMTYAGLQGVMSVLSEIRPRNDLGNWLPGNLREGNWLPNYIAARLKDHDGTTELGEWIEREAFEPLKGIPR